MTVRLRVKTSLLGGFAALLLASVGAVGGTGCVNETSKSSLDPAGPPKILQVFVLDPDESDDAFFGYFTLTYGVHPDANKCSYDKTCAGDLTCSESGETAGHCVDANGNQPIATLAPPIGGSIHIISKELLDGRTLDQFACACQQNDGCPAGMDFSIDPTNCSACGEDPSTTTIEAGKCLDLNHDGVPDVSGLQPGVATLTCTTTSGTVMITTKGGDGYYWPSGNQFPTSTQGYAGIGPAIVLEIQEPIPADSDCTIAVSDTVKDKDGNSFVTPPTPPKFHTAPVTIVGTSPADMETDVATDTSEIDIGYNTYLKSETVTAANVTVTETTGGAALAGIAVTLSNDTIVIDLSAATLKAGTSYTVSVKNITDTYGQPGEDTTFSFTTASAA